MAKAPRTAGSAGTVAAIREPVTATRPPLQTPPPRRVSSSAAEVSSNRLLRRTRPAPPLPGRSVPAPASRFESCDPAASWQPSYRLVDPRDVLYDLSRSSEVDAGQRSCGDWSGGGWPPGLGGAGPVCTSVGILRVEDGAEALGRRVIEVRARARFPCRPRAPRSSDRRLGTRGQTKEAEYGQHHTSASVGLKTHPSDRAHPLPATMCATGKPIVRSRTATKVLVCSRRSACRRREGEKRDDGPRGGTRYGQRL